MAVHNVIMALKSLSQEGCKFKVILGSIESSEFKSSQYHSLSFYLKIPEKIWGDDFVDKVLAVPPGSWSQGTQHPHKNQADVVAACDPNTLQLKRGDSHGMLAG